MTLLRPPSWTLGTVETSAGMLCVVILEAGSPDSYDTIRTQLTLTGCIGRISPTDWQQANWPDSGQLQLHHTGHLVTSLSTPRSALNIPGGLDACPEWLESANSHTLFAVVPPASITRTGASADQPRQATSDEMAIRLVDLANTGRLTAGLAIHADASDDE